MKSSSHIPTGSRMVTPYIVVNGAAKAIEFYQQVFGAKETMRFPAPGDKILHAEIQIGDSAIMLADEFPEWDAKGPLTIGGSAVSLMVYVPDCDAVVEKAVSLGATVQMPVADQFYGDRTGNIVDPFGHKWCIATHKEDVAPDELQKRAAAMFGGGK